MKVEGPKSSSSVTSKKTKKTGSARGAGDFASELSKAPSGAGSSDPAEGTERAGSVANVAGVLVTQSVDPDAQPSPEQRRRQAQRGHDILDRLEEVRRGLLIGAIPKERLADLAQMVRQRREKGADPLISKLLDEIELRAQVELAKLSMR